MPGEQPGADLRVDPDRTKQLIAAFETAANRLQSISLDMVKRGRVQTPWTVDVVSVEMAAHYNRQIFDDSYSTYAALTRYEAELRAAARTMRDILTAYEKTEAEAEAGILAAGQSRVGS